MRQAGAAGRAGRPGRTQVCLRKLVSVSLGELRTLLGSISVCTGFYSVSFRASYHFLLCGTRCGTRLWKDTLTFDIGVLISWYKILVFYLKNTKGIILFYLYNIFLIIDIIILRQIILNVKTLNKKVFRRNTWERNSKGMGGAWPGGPSLTGPAVPIQPGGRSCPVSLNCSISLNCSALRGKLGVSLQTK